MGFQHALYFSAEDTYPRPLDLSRYTKHAIKQRILWVEARRKLYVTPLIKRFLNRYMESLQEALGGDFEYAWGHVQIYDRKMTKRPRAVAIPDENEMELVDKSAKLLRLRLFGRYGDDLATMLQLPKAQVRADAGIESEVAEAQLSRFWTVVHRKIEREKRLEQEMVVQHQLVRYIETPTIRAVFMAADSLLFQHDELFAAIETFVTEGAFDSELQKCIATKTPHALAQTISADLQIVDTVEAVDEPQASQYRTVIAAVRDKYFTFGPGCEEDPATWTYTEQYLGAVIGSERP